MTNHDLIRLCIASPDLWFCNNEKFWKQRVYMKFRTDQKSEEKTWKTFFLQLVYFNDYVSPSHKFINAARYGH